MQSNVGNGIQDKVDYVIIDSDDEYEMNDLPFKAKTKEWQNEYDAQNPIEELDFVDSSKWYSITVDDPGKHSEIDIFDGILQSISPFEFVPVMHESGTTLKKFYVTKCERAIKKISLLGFQFFCQNDTTFPFRLKVVHNDPPHKKINPFKLIHDVVKLRFNLGSNELNLSNFKDSIDLFNTIYFPLWYVGNQKILKLLVKALLLGPYIHKLILGENSLRNVTGFDIPNTFPKLTSLVLSNNLIESFASLKELHGHMQDIKVLWLDGNDLCCTYVQEQHYVECVKMIFPSIHSLDGRVFTVHGFPVSQRNFTIDQTSVSLVNKFMEIYFTLFDSDERDLLTEMYTPKALFNIACQTMNVSNFHKRSRNLLHKSKGTAGNVFTGPRGIIGCLGYLPKTEHDPLSFTVDISVHSDNYTVVNITGVFKMPSSVLSQDEPVFEFMRTFIIVKVNDKYCYKIANDCLNISSHLSERAANAFITTVTVKDKLCLTNMNPSTLPRSVMNGMTDLFIMLTELPYSEARSFLERNRWNFRSALLDVINMLKKE